MENQIVKTAVVLAAGMGSRLGEYTREKPKCLVEINGIPLLENLLDALLENDFERIIIVTGYKSEMIVDFVSKHRAAGITETIHNELYDCTNNIYSLWLIFDGLKKNEAFSLFEADLIFEAKTIAEFRTPDKIALDLFNPDIHSGTTASIDKNNILNAMFAGGEIPDIASLYKTVNITSFSGETRLILEEIISKKVAQGDVNSFYETAIKELAEQNLARFEIVDFTNRKWGEVDDADDLERVSKLFSPAIVYS